MDTSELIEKYFAGETTLDEERALQRLFASNDVAQPLKPYKDMFVYYANERNVTFSPAKKFKTAIITWWQTAGIAVCAAALFLVMFHRSDTSYVYYVDGVRVYDEQAALSSVDDKLQTLAASMQKAKNGITPLKKLQYVFRKVNEQVILSPNSKNVLP
jgi:hypothetical protein